jgi:hypothetical protein
MSHEQFDPNVWTVTGEEPIYVDSQTKTLRSLQDFDAAANTRPHDVTTQIPVINPRPTPRGSTVFDDEPVSELPQENLFDPCGIEVVKGERAGSAISSMARGMARGVLWLIIVVTAMLFVVVLGVSLLYGLVARGLLWIVENLLEGIQ